MKGTVKATDTTSFLQSIQLMEKVLEKSRADATRTKVDIMSHELTLDVMLRSANAKEQGKFLVGTTTNIPTEIFFAMDIVPCFMELCGAMPAVLMGRHEEFFAASKAFGFPNEVCSVHRISAAPFIMGEALPYDAIVYSNMDCDCTAKSGDIPIHLRGCPGFFLDRPLGSGEQHVKYFTRELEELVRFLENLTGRIMDYGRLREAMALSQRSIELYREIAELRKAVPSPLKNHRSVEMQSAANNYAGDPRLVEYLEMVRDEAKENVEKGRGTIPEEKYRVMLFFVPPFLGDVLGWMEREHGAKTVINPLYDHFAEGTIDLDKPLESLARKTFYKNIVRMMGEPSAKAFLPDTIRSAREYRAEGLIFWAHSACRTVDAWARLVRDELVKELDIPTLIVDYDMADASYASTAQIRGRLEGFFELLDERK
jgi:benzoyl-CoA reductase/2-hydroxyglutaryl-CoA dehydratase subunit BcrC/BadD/HgdB